MQKIDDKFVFEVQKTEEEWKDILGEEKYKILRQKGTEAPFSSEYDVFYVDGTYYCAACGNNLFDSEHKFQSGCGWPSFSSTVNQSNVVTKDDNSLGMKREEILCAKCGGHLGHVFNDGPAPTGLRFCVNGASVSFEKRDHN